MSTEDAPAVEVIRLGPITLEWSPWYRREQVALSVADGGVSVPFAPGGRSSGW